MQPAIAIVEYISASTAGIVNVMLGFVPDFAILIQDHGGTNPSIRFWANNSAFSGWATALSLLLTGSSGVVTRDTTGPTVFAGTTQITAAESVNDDPKHVNNAGAEVTVVPFITQAGLVIPVDHQTNGGRNLLIAFRRNR